MQVIQHGDKGCEKHDDRQHLDGKNKANVVPALIIEVAEQEINSDRTVPQDIGNAFCQDAQQLLPRGEIEDETTDQGLDGERDQDCFLG